MVASAQQCPASSRATATTTIERGLPRASSACQRPCSRRALRSAWAWTTWGLPVRLRSSVTLLRVEHPPVALVEHDRERPALEPLPAKPAVVRPRPRGRLVHQPMAQQQLREPVTGPHQIAAGVLASTNEITRRLLFRPRDPDRGDLTEPKQPRQPLGVPPVGLDPIGDRIRDGAATRQLIPA